MSELCRKRKFAEAKALLNKAGELLDKAYLAHLKKVTKKAA